MDFGYPVDFRVILTVIASYLSGSILYANVFCNLFGKHGALQNSKDQNPGTANAFKFGGFWCGTLTLICDLLKGFLPVYIFCHSGYYAENWLLSAVICAPTVGHAFPIFYKFRGGKGVAVSFGCLLGLFPYLLPFWTLAAVFIFLSVCLRINPNFYRTAAAYLCALAVMIICRVRPEVFAGFLLISATVLIRLRMSSERRERPEVKLLWMH